MTKQRGHDLDRDAVAQPPGRGTVPEPVRIERDPGPGPQPQDQVIGRLIGPRVPPRLRPDVDEDMASLAAAVLLVQVAGIQPDQLRPDGDRPAAGLGPRPVRVLPRHDADLLLRGGDVLVAEAQGFSRAAASAAPSARSPGRDTASPCRCGAGTASTLLARRPATRPAGRPPQRRCGPGAHRTRSPRRACGSPSRPSPRLPRTAAPRPRPPGPPGEAAARRRTPRRPPAGPHASPGPGTRGTATDLSCRGRTPSPCSATGRYR